MVDKNRPFVDAAFLCSGRGNVGVAWSRGRFDGVSTARASA